MRADKMKGKVKRVIPGTKHRIGEIIDVQDKNSWLVVGKYVDILPDEVKESAKAK